MKKISESLKDKLGVLEHDIPNQRSGTFKARATEAGVHVDCLGSSAVIDWRVFDEVENLLETSPSRSAIRGSAMNARLGDKNLPLDSVEGQITIFYGRKVGQTVFRRISPVSNLLVWAGVCKHSRGSLILL